MSVPEKIGKNEKVVSSELMFIHLGERVKSRLWDRCSCEGRKNWR